MTNKEIFANNVLTAVKARLGEGYNVSLNPIVKNNGLTLLGLVIQKTNNGICPSIYVDDYYRHSIMGRSFEDIIEDILETYSSCSMQTCVSLDWLNDKEAALSKATYRVVNRDMNEDMLRCIPHETLAGDLVKTFYLTIEMEGGLGSALVNYELMDRLDITMKELVASANFNTPKFFPVQILSMEALLSDMLGMDSKDVVQDTGMYVISNSERNFGASTLLYEGILDEACKILDGSIYILPSSVHELIVIKANGPDEITKLKEMIHDVNTSQVDIIDQLSNNLFFYNKDTHQLSVA